MSSTLTSSAGPPTRQRCCFFDISIGGQAAGKLVFELFDNVAPHTCRNFAQLCKGEAGMGQVSGRPLHYKGSIFHRVVRNFMIQGGDFVSHDGTGGESIYGGLFDDEAFTLKHDKAFLLSMANRGPNTNASQFFITTKPAPHLDGIHVVFGKVKLGIPLVRKIENLPVNSKNKPIEDVVITDCGLLSMATPYKENWREDCKGKKRSLDGDGEANLKELGLEHLAPCSISPKEVEDNRSEVSSSNLLSSKERTGSMKGRGAVRFKRHHHSRSRSRSATPPHWKVEEFQLRSREQQRAERQEGRIRAEEIRRERNAYERMELVSKQDKENGKRSVGQGEAGAARDAPQLPTVEPVPIDPMPSKSRKKVDQPRFAASPRSERRHHGEQQQPRVISKRRRGSSPSTSSTSSTPSTLSKRRQYTRWDNNSMRGSPSPRPSEKSRKLHQSPTTSTTHANTPTSGGGGGTLFTGQHRSSGAESAAPTISRIVQVKRELVENTCGGGMAHTSTASSFSSQVMITASAQHLHSPDYSPFLRSIRDSSTQALQPTTVHYNAVPRQQQQQQQQQGGMGSSSLRVALVSNSPQPVPRPPPPPSPPPQHAESSAGGFFGETPTYQHSLVGQPASFAQAATSMAVAPMSSIEVSGNAAAFVTPTAITTTLATTNPFHDREKDAPSGVEESWRFSSPAQSGATAGMRASLLADPRVLQKYTMAAVADEGLIAATNSPSTSSTAGGSAPQYKVQFDQAKKEVEHQQKNVARLRSERNMANKRISQLWQQLGYAQAQSITLQKELEEKTLSAQAEVDSLQKKLSELNRHCEEQKKRIEQDRMLGLANANLKEEKKELMAALQQAQQIAHHYEASSCGSTNQTEREPAADLDLISRLQERLAILETVGGEKDAEIRRLESQLSSSETATQRALKESQEAVRRARTERTKMSNTLQKELEKKTHSAQAEVHSLQLQLKKTTEALKKAREAGDRPVPAKCSRSTSTAGGSSSESGGGGSFGGLRELLEKVMGERFTRAKQLQAEELMARELCLKKALAKRIGAEKKSRRSLAELSRQVAELKSKVAAAENEQEKKARELATTSITPLTTTQSTDQAPSATTGDEEAVALAGSHQTAALSPLPLNFEEGITVALASYGEQPTSGVEEMPAVNEGPEEEGRPGVEIVVPPATISASQPLMETSPMAVADSGNNISDDCRAATDATINYDKADTSAGVSAAIDVAVAKDTHAPPTICCDSTKSGRSPSIERVGGENSQDHHYEHDNGDEVFNLDLVLDYDDEDDEG